VPSWHWRGCWPCFGRTVRAAVRRAHCARALACARRTARVGLRHTHDQIGQQCHRRTVGERCQVRTHQPASQGWTALPAPQCGHGSASRWHVRPGLTCVMSAMQAFFGGNLSLVFASLSQSEVRRDYSASVSASVSVSATSSHSRGRGVGHTTRLRERATDGR
jgi:hypothetical protein